MHKFSSSLKNPLFRNIISNNKLINNTLNNKIPLSFNFATKSKNLKFRIISEEELQKQKEKINSRLKKQNSPNEEIPKNQKNQPIVKNTNYSYPLIFTSPVILSASFLFFHGTFINSELPELMKFISKSTFIYGSLAAGMSFGIKFQEDEKFLNSTYQDAKKRFFYLLSVLGLSQTLNIYALPFPVFMGLYGLMYGLLNELMSNIHPEVEDLFKQMKIILMIIGFLNLIFIYLKYTDFRSSMKDSYNFEDFYYKFYSSNDDKFESEIIEKEKCLRSVDYRLFKKSGIDV